MHRIVIVGGGAGGLELATRLGDKLGKRNKAQVSLIEKTRTHFWKPHLHEIAAGSMDIGVYETNYFAQSHWHHFRYRAGEMTGLDRTQRMVMVAPFIEDGEQVAGHRQFPYDTLVMAVGSLTNDFGTPGAKEHAISLETPAQAQRFHRRLVNAYYRAHAQPGPRRPEQLQVAIIGAGATGVELAAELHNTTRTLVSFGFDRIDPEKDMKLILIEAADRILPALPSRLSDAATRLLAKLKVNVRTSARVAEVLPDGVRLASGEVIPAELVVWAAGVKAPEFLKDLGGLETNRINQLVVLSTLQTTRDENIFAIGKLTGRSLWIEGWLLALLVAAVSSDADVNLASYRKVSDKIAQVYGDISSYHPLRAEHMRLSFNPRQLGHEWRVRLSQLSPWRRVKYFARMVLLNLAGVYLFARKIDTKAVRWSRYTDELVVSVRRP